ncbi:flagellin N-terminal helical domain-containing protein [Luxibacter massiliensis]|uniref:flagellin N-terminal helical domain-containing protein n=1 Tax=Luxibacter massiliensis TaxID=2219695 RepID=UPI000F054837|nr:hypothetical protein [Luxibacter massiliensis]
MRITTNAILRNYKSNLSASLSNLDVARTRVMTGRQFSSAAENPANALRAATLERKYMKNQDYLNTVKDAQSFQDSQEDAAMQINELAKTLSKQYGLEALNGTNGSLDIRETYADAWRGAQESMLLSLNATYEGKYIFAGADGMEPPFALETDANGNQILTYRGLDVNDPANQAALDELSKETLYLDLGFGLSVDATNQVDAASAFNTSLPGINLVGFGQDANGNPKNMILLAGEIAKTLEEPDFDSDKYKELLDGFDSGRSSVLEQVTMLGTKTQFLTTTKERLETDEISLSTQYDNVVNVDMAGAITDFSWAQYAYNAALKVGTNILSPSFIDFMS